MSNFEDAHEYGDSKEDSMFNDDSEIGLMSSEQDDEETSIRELDFNRD